MPGTIEYAVRPLGMVEDLPPPPLGEAKVISGRKPGISLYASQAWPGEVDDTRGAHDFNTRDATKCRYGQL